MDRISAVISSGASRSRSSTTKMNFLGDAASRVVSLDLSSLMSLGRRRNSRSRACTIGGKAVMALAIDAAEEITLAYSASSFLNVSTLSPNLGTLDLKASMICGARSSLDVNHQGL